MGADRSTARHYRESAAITEYKESRGGRTVWDSKERFQQFRDEELIPALQEAGGEDRIAPSISADPVHNLVTA